jgi:3'-phosphoadenosine 5'-phosphosulfate sulfotransferase (PAPS reductase)/FAD synthetase
VRDFREIVNRAIAEHEPVARVVLFSGGNDSAGLLHLLWHAGFVDYAAHVNTGIGIPQTRDFVFDFCRTYGIPLKEYHPKLSYRELVLTYGFPGPGAHALPYRYLKERVFDQIVREAKTGWFSRVMLLTGVRLEESNRRKKNVVDIERDGCAVWVAPILDWTKDDLRAYREANGVPESEVAALLHMSGECLCGAFAHKDEIKDLEAFYPEVARRIHALEDDVRAAGQKRCVWGVNSGQRRSRGGRGCTKCDFQLDLALESVTA